MLTALLPVPDTPLVVTDPVLSNSPFGTAGNVAVAAWPHPPPNDDPTANDNDPPLTNFAPAATYGLAFAVTDPDPLFTSDPAPTDPPCSTSDPDAGTVNNPAPFHVPLNVNKLAVAFPDPTVCPFITTGSGSAVFEALNATVPCMTSWELAAPVTVAPVLKLKSEPPMFS